MRCTETRGLLGLFGAGVVVALGGCSQSASPPPAPPAAEAGRAAPAEPPVRATELPAPANEPVAPIAPIAPKPAVRGAPLPPPRPVASWDEVRRQAAHRMVAANPEGSYVGTVPEPLLAIPVLEVELKRDGSVARVVVLRAPRHAKDTSALAIAAVHRAAPFGDVSRLPRPWRFTETFLFNDERKFKPRTLDE